MTGEGMILKALSGFYYVDPGDGRLISCRARGKFRAPEAESSGGGSCGLY